MFELSARTRVFLFAGATDMRLGFNGLCSLVEHQLKEDPTSGHLFVFCNRRRNRLKALFWDGSGLWVCAKRLEAGRFTWPAEGQKSVDSSRAQLTMLLEGLDWSATHAKRWFRRECADK